MPSRSATPSAGKVRIVSGKWRRRQLPVLPVNQLRPTPHRVRETVFNWLGGEVVGAVCLDLFAGTGCLGFEAASRGASEVVMVEQNSILYRSLLSVCDQRGADEVEVVRADALSWARRQTRVFDVVFLDPPFGSDLLMRPLYILHTTGGLRPGGLLYLESSTVLTDEDLPGAWRLKRTGKAGQVMYHLAST